MRRLLLGVAFLLVACGDSDGGPASDAGVPTDARFLSDASRQSCSAEMDSCAELAFERVCDVDRGRCVECNSSADCAESGSLGSACNLDRGTCECGSDADCQDNPNGQYCHPVVKACGCIDGDNCASDEECKLQPYLGSGIRTCYTIPEQQ